VLGKARFANPQTVIGHFITIMRRFTTILILAIIIVGFRSDFVNGDKVILTKDGDTTSLFIGKSKIEDIIKLFGKTKIETYVSQFPGKTEKSLFGKRQFLEYKNLGLLFILEAEGVKYKKYAKKDTCFLDEIIITSPTYCLDSICVGTNKADIINRFGNGVYPITNGITDSSVAWYSARGLTLKFENDQPSAKLIEIHREMKWDFLRARIEQRKLSRISQADSVK
jgi:hypothetical protein